MITPERASTDSTMSRHKPINQKTKKKCLWLKTWKMRLCHNFHLIRENIFFSTIQNKIFLRFISPLPIDSHVNFSVKKKSTQKIAEKPINQ